MMLEEIQTFEDVEKYAEQEIENKDRKCSGTWCHACSNDGCCKQQKKIEEEQQ